MGIKEKLSVVSSSIFGFIGLGLFLFIASLLIKGMLWFSEVIYPYLLIIGSYVFWGGIIILLPLAFFKKTRAISGVGFVISSYFYGITLWFTSLITVYVIWGKIGMFVGLFLALIGIIPEAFIASLFNDGWDEFGNLSMWLLVTIVSGGIGMWLIYKHEEESY